MSEIILHPACTHDPYLVRMIEEHLSMQAIAQDKKVVLHPVAYVPTNPFLPVSGG